MHIHDDMKLKIDKIIFFGVVIVCLSTMIITQCFGGKNTDLPATSATELATTEKPIETEKTVDLGEFKITAYCPCSYCCGKWADGITATGTKATAGRTIAVDPSVIPYGTKVIINGHEYIAEDCGGAIKENRIDVFFNTHEEALEFGVMQAEVYIVNET